MEELVAELNTRAEGSTIDFAFATPSIERNIVERQLSLLFGDRDWLMQDRAGTKVSVRASVARALLDPKFEWSKIEQEIMLAYPARAFRAHVIDAVERCVRLELAGPLRSTSALRKQWSDIIEDAARAGVQIAKIREKLARLPGWSREVASQIVEPAETRLDALAWFAQCLCDQIPSNQERGGRPPMFEFAFLVNALAQIFQGPRGASRW